METCKTPTLYRIGTALALVVSVACGDDSDSAREVEERQYSLRTFDNRGAVCLSPREDAAIAVDVFTDVCLSTSCNTPEAATCTALLEGDRLVISSQLMVTTDITPNGVCTADCGAGRVGIACGVIQPDTSSIRVAYASRRSNTVTLPLAGDTLVYDDGSIGVCPLDGETYFEQ